MDFRSNRMQKMLLVMGGIAVLAVTGCTGESSREQATGSASFRALNAIPTSPTFAFLIEEQTAGTADYKNTSTRLVFDDLDYTFNFQVALAGNFGTTRVASQLIETVRDKDYILLISGAIDTPTITVWENDWREWQTTDTVFRASFAHTAESLGPVDVYFLAPGVPPSAGQQVGTLDFAEILPYADYPQGDYVIYFTTANDPGDILYTSNTLTPTVQTGFIASIFDGDANDVTPYPVKAIRDDGAVSNLVDANSSSTVRFLHASSDLATSDIYIDEMLTAPFVTDLAFQDVTGDLPIDVGIYPVTFTAAGQVGSILFENSLGVVGGARYQFYAIGETDAFSAVIIVPDRRSIETVARLSFIHTATNHDAVDLYIVDTGTDITTALPRLFNVPIGTQPIALNLDAGDFEIYVTPFNEKTVLAGPIALTTDYGDVYETITYNNVDPAIADFVFIPLP